MAAAANIQQATLEIDPQAEANLRVRDARYSRCMRKNSIGCISTGSLSGKPDAPTDETMPQDGRLSEGPHSELTGLTCSACRQSAFRLAFIRMDCRSA